MSYDAIKITSIKALHDDVLITDMDMGEIVTSSGIVIQSDNGKVHGVKPRWGRVYCVGPEQKDVKVGQWILIEHGRWTRKLKIDDGESVKEIQKVEVKSIMAVSDEKPDTNYIGKEYSDGQGLDIRPEDFIR